jgi:hypothetical protein
LRRLAAAEANQDGNDCDYHQKLDQRETGAAIFLKYFFVHMDCSVLPAE